jgi:hypothetical protein
LAVRSGEKRTSQTEYSSLHSLPHSKQEFAVDPSSEEICPLRVLSHKTRFNEFSFEQREDEYIAAQMSVATQSVQNRKLAEHETWGQKLRSET